MVFLVSLSAGTMLGGAFIHILPEAIEKGDNKLFIWLLVLFGIIIFFVLEKIIHWRHCHIETSIHHPHPMGIMNLIGDGLHNFIDGLVIGSSYLISFELGLATTVAIISHEIPQEIGDFGVLIYAGYTKNKALLYNFLSATIAIAGTIIALLIGNILEDLSIYILPIAAGSFIYVAVADLIPELKKESKAIGSIIQLICILIGIALMIIIK